MYLSRKLQSRLIPVKKEEPAASEAPAEDKDKPAETPKADEAAAKPETKVSSHPRNDL